VSLNKASSHRSVGFSGPAAPRVASWRAPTCSGGGAPRATDELVLPVWFDEVGPVAAAGLTAWGDTWQADVFAVPSIVDEASIGWHAKAHAA